MKKYTIKPLVWVSVDDEKDSCAERAESIGSMAYEVWKARGDGTWKAWCNQTARSTNHGSVEEAKAACNDDWQKRLMPALEESTNG